MPILVAVALVHIASWVAVGAALAPRAGLRRWLGALVSILVPVFGALALTIAAVVRRVPRPGLNSSGWLASWAALAGGVMLAIGAFLPWVKLDVAVDGAGQEHQLMSFESTSVDSWFLLALICAIGVLAGAVATQRWRVPEWAALVSVAALTPTGLSVLLILSQDVVGDVSSSLNSVGTLAELANLEDAAVSNTYEVASGAFVSCLGGLLALCAALAMATLGGRTAPMQPESPADQIAGGPPNRVPRSAESGPEDWAESFPATATNEWMPSDSGSRAPEAAGWRDLPSGTAPGLDDW